MASDSKYVPIPVKFVVAALSGIGATAFAYPFELLKNRMQMSGEFGKSRDHKYAFQFGIHIVKTEGFFGLYSGFSAAALRQVLYTGSRMGTMQALLDYYTIDGKAPRLHVKFAIGVVTGALGAAIALPTDVAMIRMALDTRLPPEKRRNYKGVFNALFRIYKEEGVATMFRGFTPTVMRAIVINTSQVLTYMQVKEVILGHDLMRDGTLLHIVCSFWAALAQTVCSQPLDIAKTRLQNMKEIDGKMEYSGFLDVWKVVVYKEGFFGLWKGFTPYFIKNGPQAVMFFVLFEKLFLVYKKLFVPDD